MSTAGAVWVLAFREPPPPPPPPPRTATPQSATTDSTSVLRAPRVRDIEQALRYLEGVIAEAQPNVRSQAGRLLMFQGLGLRRMAASGASATDFFANWEESHPLASLDSSADEPELASARALAILLEAGLNPSDSLATRSGPRSGTQVVQSTWQAAVADSQQDLKSAHLSCGALGALAGVVLDRDSLTSRAEAALATLERALKDYGQSRGQGPLDPEELARVRELRKQGEGLFAFRDQGIELALGAFRALTFLRDPPLREAGKRVLAGFLYKHRVDRALDPILQEGLSGRELDAVRLDAIERMGRGLHLLYTATLAVREPSQPLLPPGTALVMRNMAFDLMRELQALQEHGFIRDVMAHLTASTPYEVDYLRGLVHALRGLRVARAALPEMDNPHR